MTAVHLRRTSPGDFKILRSLFDDPAFHDWGGPGRLPDDGVRRKYLGLRFPDVECFIVLVGDQAVGLGQIHAGPDSGGGMDLILLPSARGQGIGRTAVAKLTHQARVEREWVRITVDPDLQNEAGIRFWRSVGFTPDKTVLNDPGRPPYLVMVLPDRSLNVGWCAAR